MVTYNEQQTRRLWGLTAVSAVLLGIALILNFVYPGTETTQGEVQRLFYIHVGAFFGSFVVFFLALVAGVQYLRTRETGWDHLGVSAVEIGLGLSLVNIVTGMFWARPIWNTWWTWDPRLTTVAIMWLAYAAYLMLRTGIEDPDRRRRFAAVYGILAFGSVILTVIIIRIRPDTIHPVAAGPSTTSSQSLGDFDMTDPIRNTLFFNVFVFMILACVLTWHRLRLERRAEQLELHRSELAAT